MSKRRTHSPEFKQGRHGNRISEAAGQLQEIAADPRCTRNPGEPREEAALEGASEAFRQGQKDSSKDESQGQGRRTVSSSDWQAPDGTRSGLKKSHRLL